MKKVISILMILGLATMLLVGCASEEPASQSSDSRTYFINPKSIGPAYWSAAEKGATQAGEDLGVEVIFNAPTTVDSSKQVNMIQDMLVRDIDGLASAPNDPGAIAPVFKKALDQGVEVITWDSDAPKTDRKYYVAPATDKQLGEEFAEALAKQIDGKGKVAFMVAGLGAQNQIAKADAAKNYLAENYPEVKVVTMVASNDDQQKAFSNAQNLLETYPDLKGIIGFAGAECPAAAEAVQQAVDAGKLAKGDVAITGFAVPSLVKQYMKNDIIEKVIMWDPGKLGYATVYTLDQLAQGKKITDGMEVPSVGKVKVSGEKIFIGTIELTKDNVDDFDF